MTDVHSHSQGPSLAQLARRSFWLLFAAIFLVAGLLAVVIGAGLAWQESRFAAEGRTAEGQVLGRSIREADAAEDRGTEYVVTYRFTTDDGRTFDGSDTVTFDQWEALVEQGPISIEYLVGDPNQHRAALGGDVVVVAAALGAGALCLALGIGLTVWQVRRLLRTRRLWREGAVAEGTVVRVEPANVTVNKRPLFRLRYEYEDAAGTRHGGTSELIPWEDAEGWQPGDRGAVRFDRQRPAQSIWLGEPPGAQVRS